MAFADSPQLIVIDPGPAAALHRMLRPLMKGLSQKLRTGSSELDDSRPSAGRGHWRNATSALQLMSILIALTVSHCC